jgi:hypothetical protein
VDQTEDITEQRQDDVQPEMLAETDLEKNSQAAGSERTG